MARVHVLREIKTDFDGGWPLCFQWCRYAYDDNTTQFGYRFIWRRPSSEGGGLQAARGQARIPSLAEGKRLMEGAEADGWGGFDGDEMQRAADRLRNAGCVVDFGTGYVGWPNAEAAQRGRLTEQIIDDEALIRELSRSTY
jgi:hypothetical protein